MLSRGGHGQRLATTPPNVAAVPRKFHARPGNAMAGLIAMLFSVANALHRLSVVTPSSTENYRSSPSKIEFTKKGIETCLQTHSVE